MTIKYSILLMMALIGLTTVISAQDLEFPGLDQSPMDAAHYPARSAFQNYLSEDDPDRSEIIKVLYSRPNKKDRVIFGDLVPYGEEWRLGANEALEVTFNRPVEIGGQYIGSGTYTMFADVYPSQWIIKISTERFIAGTQNRDKSQDIVTAIAPTSPVPGTREAYTIGFQKVDEGNVNMIFEWDQTRATLPINLNPPSLDGADASPMDLAQYPNSSRFRNFQSPEDLDKAVAKVRVIYSRPQMKERSIFGELIKYGEMWRVGANQTTVLTFFQDVEIGGTTVKKGKYGMFAVVNQDNWEFIIHKNVQSWGQANHDAKDNVVSLKAPTEKTPTTLDALSIIFQETGDNKVDMIIGWENTMARLPISIVP